MAASLQILKGAQAEGSHGGGVTTQSPHQGNAQLRLGAGPPPLPVIPALESYREACARCFNNMLYIVPWYRAGARRNRLPGMVRQVPLYHPGPYRSSTDFFRILRKYNLMQLMSFHVSTITKKKNHANKADIKRSVLFLLHLFYQWPCQHLSSSKDLQVIINLSTHFLRLDTH